MGLLILNPLNGTSIPEGATLNDRLGLSDVVIGIQESKRNLSDNVIVSENIGITLDVGGLSELIDFVETNSAEIEPVLEDSISFSCIRSTHIETSVGVTLSVSDNVTLYPYWYKTLDDTFLLTDDQSSDIFVSQKERVQMDELVSTLLESSLSDTFSISDSNNSYIQSTLDDSVTFEDGISGFFIQPLPIGKSIAIGMKLIG